jgi:hypothetical protein
LLGAADGERTTGEGVDLGFQPGDLAGEFGQDFGTLLVTGRDPFKEPLAIPSWDRIRVTTLGEAPLDPDCEQFGRAPGIDGMVGDYLGLPPEWTDKGPRDTIN